MGEKKVACAKSGEIREGRKSVTLRRKEAKASGQATH